MGLFGGDPRSGSDRGHSSRRTVAALALSASMVAAAVAGGAEDGSTPLAKEWRLSTIEGSPETSSDSAIVEVPVSFTLRPPEGRRPGFRLRLSVLFAWNDVQFEDIDGEHIAASLRTLTVVPGVELVIPVAERWLVRPYGQLGGLNALGVDGHRWLASLGVRAGADWDFEAWRLRAGGRAEYTTVLDEDGHRVDEATFVDVGGGFSWPLWFEVGEAPVWAGLYLIPRAYLSGENLIGEGSLVSDLRWQVEIGASFELDHRPSLWFAKLPTWYGAGVRLAPGHRSVRLYLGFPF